MKLGSKKQGGQYQACRNCKRKILLVDYPRTALGGISQTCADCHVEYRKCERCNKRGIIGTDFRPAGRICATCLRAARRKRQREWVAARRLNDPDFAERDREHSREWAREHADRKRGYNRVENMSPERLARDRQSRRISRRLKAELRNGQIPARVNTNANGAYVQPTGNHQKPMLPVAPLAEWLKYEFGDWSVVELSIYIGVDDSHLSKIVERKQEKVSLFIADQICVGADCTHMLGLLYPELEAA